MGQRWDPTMADFAFRNRFTVVPHKFLLPLFLGMLSGLGGCAIGPGGGQPSLRTNITGIVFSPSLDQVLWGILVVDPEEDLPLFSLNAHKKFVPASNMKILPTVTALSLLGPEYRYQTEVWGVGRLADGTGVLDGDLVLRATGDPTLSERFYPSVEAPLDSLANGLWTSGIRSVTGSLVVDVSAWDSTTVPGTWMVGDLAGTSAATGGAFALGEGVLTIEATAGPEPGSPAQTRWWPRGADDFVSAAFVTTHPDSARRGRTIHYRPESKRLQIEGRVRAGRVDTIRISQREPVPLASAALLRALERRGIQVTGELRIAWEAGESVGSAQCMTGSRVEDGGFGGRLLPDCPEATRYATLTSPTMAEIVKAILEPSQNWMAEQLVRTLGMEKGRSGSWQEGFRVQQEFLVQEVGVDSLDITYRDGSGLSAYNLVTPRAMVEILSFMKKSELAAVFQDALASPGEEAGTLSGRLTGLEGRVFAKTGTLTHVASLSGYVHTDSGRELVFSILSNNSGLSSQAVRTGIDNVVKSLVRW
jgi:D-alanyl-D-alanine carboxypeptidase/D-alanyl-D-alanine-endopeptidase (penicillin-binding protein 4)